MEKRKIVFYLTIGMILILHLTACTNRSSELPAPDSTVFGYEGETKIIFDGVCAKYNDMPIHMLQARQHQRQIHIIILTFSMIIRGQMLGIV